MFGQLGALALDLGREVFLIGAKPQCSGDQCGALLAQSFFDGLDLFGHTGPGVLQTQGLAGQIIGGHTGRVLGFTRRCGQIGGTRGKRSLGLPQLCLSQI